MFFLGIDPGAKGGVALLEDNRLVYAAPTKIKTTLRGTERLLHYGLAVRARVQQAKEIVKERDAGVIQPYVEEPPLVRSVKTYAILMQYMAVAMVTAQDITLSNPIPLKVPTWKSLIDCSNTYPRYVGGKKISDKLKNEYLKSAIKEAIMPLLAGDSYSIAEEAADGKRFSDIYDAIGIALAGRERYNKTTNEELEL